MPTKLSSLHGGSAAEPTGSAGGAAAAAAAPPAAAARAEPPAHQNHKHGALGAAADAADAAHAMEDVVAADAGAGLDADAAADADAAEADSEAETERLDVTPVKRLSAAKRTRRESQLSASGDDLAGTPPSKPRKLFRTGDADAGDEAAAAAEAAAEEAEAEPANGAHSKTPNGGGSRTRNRARRRKEKTETEEADDGAADAGEGPEEEAEPAAGPGAGALKAEAGAETKDGPHAEADAGDADAEDAEDAEDAGAEDALETEAPEAEDGEADGASPSASDADSADERRQQAVASLTEIEVEFAALRDLLHDEQLARFELEIRMCAEGSHPELTAVYQVIQARHDERVRRTRTLLDYQLQCIDTQTRAARAQIHQQFLKDRFDLRSDMLCATTQEWYQVNYERRAADSMVPDFAPGQGALSRPPDLPALVAVSKYAGFPAAPAMAAATEPELADDLSALGLR